MDRRLSAIEEAASVVDPRPHITAVCVDGSRDLLRTGYFPIGK